MKSRKNDYFGIAAALAAIIGFITLAVATIAAWITHVVACIQNEQFLFMIIGAIAAPIGVIHGVMVWMGAA